MTQQIATVDPPFQSERNGVVYTQRWVVDLILDLAGYTADRDLQRLTIVEPAGGDGSFMVAIAERLIKSSGTYGRALAQSSGAIACYELDPVAADHCRSAVREVLEEHGVDRLTAIRLTHGWIRQADYLLDRDGMPQADIIVGNPPYIRLENIPSEKSLAYRSRYATMVGRADVYIAFFEAALSQLKPEGICTFICADRWMLNQYGSALRRLITTHYAVDTVIELHRADVFRSDVSAYPAITCIRKGTQGQAVVARAGKMAARNGATEVLSVLHEARRSQGMVVTHAGMSASSVNEWFAESQPWPCYNPERLALLKKLEAEFYPLDSKGTATRSGIGIASGADSVYLTKDADIVESDRLLPMAMAKDIRSGELEWSGTYLINPWDQGGLVDLEKNSRLKAYFGEREEVLRNRHVGKKHTTGWYRTIDRVEMGLLGKSKLYVADIKERLDPVIDHGETYPHHNLYFIQSAGWNLEVLGGLLLSDVAQFFIECYGVRMRGGYLRFQAQYLRRIRLPRPQDISSGQAETLKLAFQNRDRDLATEIALCIYGIEAIPEEEPWHG